MRINRGFTLIELLVVIAIIGILATVIMTSLTTAQEKSRDTARLAALQQMATILRLANTGNVVTTFSGCTGAHVDVRTCSAPAIFNFTDPNGTAACNPNSGAAACQYSISQLNGTAGATTANYQICSYLEYGVGNLPQGWVSITSGDSSIISGCHS